MSSRPALARAALDPMAAIEALRAPVRNALPARDVAIATVSGPPAAREHALTLAVEVDPPPEFRRWRFLLFYFLVRLAAWVYPFRFEIYRTPRDGE